MIIENQKELIENTLVNNSRNVSESIELKKGEKIPMDIFRNYFNSYGFLYTNKDMDVLRDLSLENKYTGTYNFDVKLGKYVVEKDKPAILKIPNFNREKILCDVFCSFTSISQIDLYKINVSLISKGQVFSILDRKLTSYWENGREYLFVEMKNFNYDIDPNDFWIKFESNYDNIKFGILAFGVKEISPIIPE